CRWSRPSRAGAASGSRGRRAGRWRKAGKALSGRIDSRALYRQRVPASMNLTFPRVEALKPLGDQLLAENGDVGKVPVALVEVEAIPDHEAVRDLEADVAHGNVDLAARRLGHQRADLQGGG